MGAPSTTSWLALTVRQSTSRGPAAHGAGRPKQQLRGRPQARMHRAQTGALDGTNLLADVRHAALVEVPHHVGQGEGPPVHLHLDQGGGVHLVEQDQPTKTVLQRVNLGVGRHGSTEAGEDERREGARLRGPLPVRSEQVPGLRDVELEQAVHHGLAVAEGQRVQHGAALHGEGEPSKTAG